MLYLCFTISVHSDRTLDTQIVAQTEDQQRTAQGLYEEVADLVHAIEDRIAAGGTE